MTHNPLHKTLQIPHHAEEECDKGRAQGNHRSNETTRNLPVVAVGTQAYTCVKIHGTKHQNKERSPLLYVFVFFFFI